eukprot:TRINITY_DN616_c0_g1_i1.p1 TRINITY_DN616_c0_g1~~TRINITY_DN616_c0_g1_i1.p1  ORF type:complete len:2234 (-),score=796.31 TRINITY_DN616_c0_g1_i1:836-7321(-)
MNIESEDGLTLTTDGSVDIEGGALHSDVGDISVSAGGDGNVSAGGALDLDAATSTLTGGSLSIASSMDDMELRAGNLLDIESDGATEFLGGDMTVRAGDGVITMKSLQDLVASGSTVSFQGMNSFNYRSGSIEATAAKALDAVGNFVKFTSGGTTSIRSEFNNILVNAADEVDVNTAVFVAEGSNGVFVESLQGEIVMQAESSISLDIKRDVLVSTEKEILFDSFNGTTRFTGAGDLTLHGANGVLLYGTDPTKETDLVGLESFNITATRFALNVQDGGNLDLESVTESISFEAKFALDFESNSVTIGSFENDVELFAGDDVVFDSSAMAEDSISLEALGGLLFSAESLLHFKSGSFDTSHGIVKDAPADVNVFAPYVLARVENNFDIFSGDVDVLATDLVFQGGDITVASDMISIASTVALHKASDVKDTSREALVEYVGSVQTWTIMSTGPKSAGGVLNVDMANGMIYGNTTTFDAKDIDIVSNGLLQMESVDLQVLAEGDITGISHGTTLIEGRSSVTITGNAGDIELTSEYFELSGAGVDFRHDLSSVFHRANESYAAVSEETLDISTSVAGYVSFYADDGMRVDGIATVNAARDIIHRNFTNWFWDAHEGSVEMVAANLMEVELESGASVVAKSLLLEEESDDMRWEVGGDVYFYALGNDNIDFFNAITADWLAGGEVLAESTGRLTITSNDDAQWNADTGIFFDASEFFYARVRNEINVELSAFFTAQSDGDFRAVALTDLTGDFGRNGDIVGETVLVKGGELVWQNFGGSEMDLIAGTSMYLTAKDDLEVEALASNMEIFATDQINAVSEGTLDLVSGGNVQMDAGLSHFVLSDGPVTASAEVNSFVNAGDTIRLIGADVRIKADEDLSLFSQSVRGVSAENRHIVLEARDVNTGNVFISSVNDTLVSSNDDIRWDFQGATALVAETGQMLVRATDVNADIFMFATDTTTFEGYDHVNIRATDITRGGHEVYFSIGRDQEFVVDESTADVPAQGGITLNAGGQGVGIRIRSFVEPGSDVNIVAGRTANVTVDAFGVSRGEADTGPLVVFGNDTATFTALTDDVNVEAAGGKLFLTSARNMTFEAQEDDLVMESTGKLAVVAGDSLSVNQVGTVTNDNGIGVEILSDSGHMEVSAVDRMTYTAAGLIDIDAGNDIGVELGTMADGRLRFAAGTVFSIEAETGIYVDHDLSQAKLELNATEYVHVSSSRGNDIGILSDNGPGSGVELYADETLRLDGVRGVHFFGQDLESITDGKLTLRTEGSIGVDSRTSAAFGVAVGMVSEKEQRWTSLDQITAFSQRFVVGGVQMGEVMSSPVMDIDAGGTPLVNGFVSSASDSTSLVSQQSFEMFAGSSLELTAADEVTLVSDRGVRITSTGTSGSVSDITLAGYGVADISADSSIAVGSSERIALRSSQGWVTLKAVDELLMQTSREIEFNSLGPLRMAAELTLEGRTGETRFDAELFTTLRAGDAFTTRSEGTTQLVANTFMEISATAGGDVAFETVDRDSAMSFVARGTSSEARLISAAVSVRTDGALELLADDRVSVFSGDSQWYKAGGELTMESSDTLFFEGLLGVNITSSSSFPGSDIVSSSADLLQAESTGNMNLFAGADIEILSDGTTQFSTVFGNGGDIAVDVVLDTSIDAQRDFQLASGASATFDSGELTEFGSEGSERETSIGTRFKVVDSEGVLTVSSMVGIVDVLGVGGTSWQAGSDIEMDYTSLVMKAHDSTGIQFLVDGAVAPAHISATSLSMSAEDGDFIVLSPHPDEDAGYGLFESEADLSFSSLAGNMSFVAEQARYVAFGNTSVIYDSVNSTTFTARGASNRDDAVEIHADQAVVVSPEGDIDIEGLDVFIGVDSPRDGAGLVMGSRFGGALFFSEGNNEDGNGVELYGSSEANMVLEAGGSIITEAGGASFLSGANGASFQAVLDVEIQSNTNVSFVGEGQPHSVNERVSVDDEVGVELLTTSDDFGIGDDIQLTSQFDMYIRSARDLIGQAQSTLVLSAGGIVELFAETDALLEAYDGNTVVQSLLDIDIESSADTYITSGGDMSFTANNDIFISGNSDTNAPAGQVLIRSTGGNGEGDITFEGTGTFLRADVVESAANTAVIFPVLDTNTLGTCGDDLPERAFWIDSVRQNFCFCRSFQIQCLVTDTVVP